MSDDLRPITADLALLELLKRLEDAGYEFTSPTSRTLALVQRRQPASPDDVLRDILGWGRPFAPEEVPTWLTDALEASNSLERDASGCRSRVRVSTLDGRFHLHSAVSNAKEAVFLGPDSYRYVRFMRAALADFTYWRALEIGVGAGAGALALAAWQPQARVMATDINAQALRFAGLNARHAGLRLELRLGTMPSPRESFDLIIANPPYIAGSGGRVYRDGGDHYGAEVAFEWIKNALPQLAEKGRLILYTGAPIIKGQDLVKAQLLLLAARQGASLTYEEIDPDVFGATLKRPEYRQVERIAAVGAVITRLG